MPIAGLLLENARVLTMDPARPQVQAVAVRGNRIMAVGDESTVRDAVGQATRRIDCGGATVVPGFHDPHLHVLGHAGTLLGIDCGPEQVRSIADILERIRAAAADLPPGEWIRAWGYHEFSLAEGRHPSRWDLDRATPDHPVRLLHQSGHACVLNSAAMQLAGIDMTTEEPPGGAIERDLDSGEPNGILFEMAPYLSARNVPPGLTARDLDRGVALANQAYVRCGITTLHDATLTNGLADWDLFRNLKERGILLPRVTMMVGVDQLGEFLERNMVTGWGDDHLRVGALKLVLTESTGSPFPPEAVLREVVLLAHRTGFQVAVHAVEARQVAAALDAVAYAQQGHARPDARHRMEHASICPPHLVDRLGSLEMTVVTQPAFVHHNGERFREQVAEHDLPWLYRLRGLVSSGVPLVLSSDAPVVPPDPWITLRAAVTRRTAAGRVLGGDEHLSLAEALHGMTAAAARVDFREDRLGVLAEGYLADLVVLDRDLATVPHAALSNTGVRLTVIDGEIAWES